MPQKTSQTLIEIKTLLEANAQTDREWKAAMLAQLQALNGTVKGHTTDIALLQAENGHHDEQIANVGKRLEAACEDLKGLELSQAKTAGIGAIVGAIVAALPQLLTALRAWVK